MKGNKEYLYKIFDIIHEEPELSLQEFRTSEFLAGELCSLGYSVKRDIGGIPAVMGILDSGDSGPFVSLRADMDALPYDENGTTITKHTCGHDSHCAMVLNAARFFAENGIRRGRLGILFQPAEEIFAGALAISESGILNDVDELIGIHIRPKDELSFGTASSALYHSAGGTAKIKVSGKVAHGARPHQGVNAVEAATAIISSVSMIKTDPRVSHSIKATQIRGGGMATNIIPDSCEIVFDIRSQTNPVIDDIIEKLMLCVSSTAKAFGAEAEINIRSYPAAEFDAESVENLHKAIETTLGSGCDVGPLYSPGGEDFHFYRQKLPKLKTAFLGVGAEAFPGLHDRNMEFRHESMEHGCDILIEAVAQRLC